MARVYSGNNMLTTRQLARLLNVHINTVRRWNNMGILKAYRIGPRGDRRFSREDVIRFLAEQESQNQQEDLIKTPLHEKIVAGNRRGL